MCRKRLRNSIGLVVFLATAPWLFACNTTQLRVSPVPPKPDSGTITAPNGMVYFLPYLEIDIEHRRKLIQCKTNKPKIQVLVNKWIREELTNFEEIQTALEIVADTGPSEKLELEANLKTALSEEAFDAIKSILEKHVDQEGTKWQLKPEKIATIVAELAHHHFTPSTPDIAGSLPDEFTSRLEGKPKGLLKDLTDFTRSTSITLSAELKIAHNPDIIFRYVPDASHAYSLAYQGLRDGAKKTSIDVEKYANGTLKSINAGIEDRSAQIIAGALKGAIRLATAANGIPLPAGDGAQAAEGARAPRSFAEFSASLELCKPSILNALAERDQLANALEPGEAELLAVNKAIESLEKELTAAKAELAKLEKDGVAASDPRLQAARTKVSKLKSKLEANANQKKRIENNIKKNRGMLTAVEQKLTQTTVFTFRPDASNRQEPIHGLELAAEAWFNESRLEDYCSENPTDCVTVAGKTYPTILQAYAAVYLAPKSNIFVSQKSQADTSDHLVYREPVRGQLMICKKRECLDNSFSIAVEKDDIVATKAVTLPQAGVLAVLPLVNKGFQNNTLQASFSEDGALAKLTYTSNARLEAMAESFASSADSIAGFLEARREADKAALDRETAELEAEKNRLAAELEVEKAKRALEDFRNGESADETESGEN